MSTVCNWTASLIVGFVMTGCATHNYDFAAVPNGPSRITRLVDDLDRLKVDGDAGGEELYDVGFDPLLHSRLHVFAKVDEEDTPAAFIEADIETCLPLFGFVNGSVSQYDENQQLLTRHDFDSNLWGAFRNQTELIATRAGHRAKTRYTFLWLFGWWGEETWHPAAEADRPS